MRKDYYKWRDKKEKIHNHNERLFFMLREVWFCHMGENIGFEQDGKGEQYLRPVIILRKFNNQLLWAVPLTRAEKSGRYYFSFMIRNRTNTAILSQLRLMDAKRLKYKIGVVPKRDFVVLKAKIRQLLV